MKRNRHPRGSGDPVRTLLLRFKAWIPAFAGMTMLTTVLWSQELPFTSSPDDTWANWERRLERAFEGIPLKKVPGGTMGILVPNETRIDVLPLAAFSHEILADQAFTTMVILMPAPATASLNGLAIPDLEILETSFGRFVVDAILADRLRMQDWSITTDNSLFSPVPPLLESQLATLKFALKRKLLALKILPIFVKFNDLNSQVKDYAPAVADKIKDLDLQGDLVFVVVGNLSQSSLPEKQVQTDAAILNALRNLDVESLIEVEQGAAAGDYVVPDIGALAMGTLLLKWLGGDHAQILAYAHSAQLVLTKNKKTQTGFAAGAFASGQRIMPRLPHAERVQMVEIFHEGLRLDILAMTRQTCASILNPTAAKPPSLEHEEAGKRWPVYVSLYDPEGKLAGQAGSHLPEGPLEESIRRTAVEAVRQAQPRLTKDNIQNYVVDVSIPYGFFRVREPEALVPLLHGVVVQHKRKTTALHPDAWRTTPDAHQLLGSACVRLGLLPWAYATEEASIDSFRVLSFNEKEPFQDLGATVRQKKKKKKQTTTEEPEEEGGEAGGGAAEGGGLFPF